MINLAVTKTIRDRNNNITSCILADETGAEFEVLPNELKSKILNNEVYCFNAKISKDGKLLVTPTEKAEYNLIADTLTIVRRKYGDKILKTIYCPDGAKYIDKEPEKVKATKESNNEKGYRYELLGRYDCLGIYNNDILTKIYRYRIPISLPEVRLSLNKIIKMLGKRMSIDEYNKYKKMNRNEVPDDLRCTVANYRELEVLNKRKRINTSNKNGINVKPALVIIVDIGMQNITREIKYFNMTYELRTHEVIQGGETDKLDLNLGSIIYKDKEYESDINNINDYISDIISKLELKILKCEYIRLDESGNAKEFKLVDRDGDRRYYKLKELSDLINNGDAICGNLPQDVKLLSEATDDDKDRDIHSKIHAKLVKEVKNSIDTPESIKKLGTRIARLNENSYTYENIEDKGDLSTYLMPVYAYLDFLNNSIDIEKVIKSLSDSTSKESIETLEDLAANKKAKKNGTETKKKDKESKLKEILNLFKSEKKKEEEAYLKMKIAMLPKGPKERVYIHLTFKYVLDKTTDTPLEISLYNISIVAEFSVTSCKSLVFRVGEKIRIKGYTKKDKDYIKDLGKKRVREALKELEGYKIVYKLKEILDEDTKCFRAVNNPDIHCAECTEIPGKRIDTVEQTEQLVTIKLKDGSSVTKLITDTERKELLGY